MLYLKALPACIGRDSAANDTLWGDERFYGRQGIDIGNNPLNQAPGTGKRGVRQEDEDVIGIHAKR